MLFSVRMRATGPKGEHISGAEGIYDAVSVQRAVDAYTKRALSHPRGEPHEVTLRVERIKGAPREIAALPVRTLLCATPAQANRLIRELLGAMGISRRAVEAGLRVVHPGRAMRGAALIDAQTGKRLEPDRQRGVRATRMGMTPEARIALARKLARRGINTETVREALVLASKVAGAPGVVAELCVSDDPHYTTGYIASARLGYVRIPHIKKKGSTAGGRAIFVGEGTDIARLVRYLEETPVLVARASTVYGETGLDELTG